MKFGQIFLGINILMDHHTDGSMIPKINAAGSIKTTEFAVQKAHDTSGVDYPLVNHQRNQDIEDLALIAERSKKDFGPQSFNSIRNRKTQQFTYTPPTVQQMTPDQIEKSDKATESWFKGGGEGCCHDCATPLAAVGIPASLLGIFGLGYCIKKTYENKEKVKEVAIEVAAKAAPK
ncbi:hypothetical protein DFH28DRAFT_1117095 [Melampsora americana]|nr:hypothetical protein DFH28DRAFT_1117095 [Melampsora americana]